MSVPNFTDRCYRDDAARTPRAYVVDCSFPAANKLDRQLQAVGLLDEVWFGDRPNAACRWRPAAVAERTQHGLPVGTVAFVTLLPDGWRKVEFLLPPEAGTGARAPGAVPPQASRDVAGGSAGGHRE